MPHFASAIQQSKAIVKKLREGHNRYESRLIYPTPIDEPINLNSPNLITVMGELCEINIQVTRIDTESDMIDAFCIKSTSRHSVYLSKKNVCEYRYFICKELSHLLVYTDENATISFKDLEDLMSGLINNLESPAVKVEHLAYYVAMEMLIPSDIVPDLLKLRGILLNDSSQTDNPNLRIARKLLVPEFIVEFRLDHADVFDKLYNDSLLRLNLE